MARHTMKFIATVLGLFFVYNGFGKINPKLNADLHLQMKKHFVNYARVAPLRTYLDKKFKASDYRNFIGGMEIAGGAGMVLLSGRFTLQASQLFVLLASAFMIHTHVILGDPFPRAATLIATSLMVVVQMVFTKFVDKDTQEEEKATKKSSAKTDEAGEGHKKEVLVEKNDEVKNVQEKPKTKKQKKKAKKDN
ncbi:novel acetylcholine receptor chaperone-like [Asterias amurensis]|uniref:novel acetylcholine receptor chaperone-like n=1 Tax=Asterias amurensis TaxID=7602 RepID=UPI003AB47178